MLAMTLCSCKFVKSKEPAEETAGKNTTTTTAKTSTTESEVGVPDEESEDFTIYVTDTNGEYITNKDGSKKTEVFKVDELEKQLENELSKQEKSTTKKASGSNSKTESKTDAASSLLGDTQSSKEDLLPEGQKADKTTLMKTIVEPVLKSGTYTIKGSIKAEGQSMNTSVGFRNGGKDYSVMVALGAFSVKVFSVDGKYYMALPMFAKYAEVSKEEMGDMNDMTDSFKPKDAKYVKTTTVKSGKTTYTCEEYTADTGTIKYYFNEKKEWKRMEIIDGDEILVWEITSFSNKADDSLFSTKGMIKDNSMLNGLA